MKTLILKTDNVALYSCATGGYDICWFSEDWTGYGTDGTVKGAAAKLVTLMIKRGKHDSIGDVRQFMSLYKPKETDNGQDKISSPSNNRKSVDSIGTGTLFG